MLAVSSCLPPCEQNVAEEIPGVEPDVEAGEIDVAAIGETDDPVWTGTGEATVISILKALFLQEEAIGDVDDPAWSGTGDATVISILKALFAQEADYLPAGTDRSGTIVAAGTSQQLAAANATRKGLVGQNISGNDLWRGCGCKHGRQLLHRRWAAVSYQH
jgi:hypothetical protein